jgi:23S rRNA pseudouridine1911/1915/1917 synthase
MEEKQFVVDEASSKMRLDVYLAKRLEEKSRSYIQNLIEDNRVQVNNKLRKSNYKLNNDDSILVTIPDPIEMTIKAQNIPLDIIYEDSDLIVINKPRGMVVHPAAGVYEDTLVNALLSHCRDLSGINGVSRPGIVHRIDKNTSGVIVVAKNDYAHNKLAIQLKDHTMNRIYLALVEGIIKEEEGTLDLPLARHPIERVKIAVVKDGRRAVTHYKVIEKFDNNTLIECKLETGRTHQIRVHMSYMGHPIVGDPVYGYKKQRFRLEGQLLHAKLLGFIHPKTEKYVEFSTEPPEDFKKVINILRNELK